MKNWIIKKYIQGLTVITLWGLIIVFNIIGMPNNLSYESFNQKNHAADIALYSSEYSVTTK